MWKIKLHPLVVKEDIPALPPQEWLKIKKAIRKKLTIAPTQYGEPLSTFGSLELASIE